ncbi:glycosyltransferase [uncultured Leuconostoc sp.]|uniref:glycosyltransferase n=1 Tax=uncultured Leuconostoc sp. TaxID=173262 RepID=UPI0028042105|nr:glycosyltransferase [uncultured Leuconostoc sp.]
MTKKVLMLAAKANMIQQFNHRNIKILQELGYEVHVATNMIDFGSMSSIENERFKNWMTQNNVISHQIDFERRMGSFKGNIRSLKQLTKLFKQHDFSFVHVHSPLGGILGRLVAKQFNVPAIYTAHGFHFFKGGPKSGWLVFFPLEWIFSFITHTIITINEEDYLVANNHMHARHLVQINGNGVDVEKAWAISEKYKKDVRRKIRSELDIPDDAFLILSVGELSERKNHQVVLDAIGRIEPKIRNSIYYIIAGTGSLDKILLGKAKAIGFSDHFKLLGYRNDIHELNYASDLFVFPSLREGLGIAGLEATIDGLSILGTEIGGVSDYLKDGINGELFEPTNSDILANKILKNIKNPFKTQKFNFLEAFDQKIVDKIIEDVYKQF